jgi:hypothetical protein
MQITLEAVGGDAKAALEPVKAFFESEWGAKAEAAASSIPAAPGEQAKDDALLAVAAIVLSLPGNILATLQLMEKAQLKARFSSALQELRAVLRDCRGDVVLRIGDKTFDLRLASAEEVFDDIAEEEKKHQSK